MNKLCVFWWFLIFDALFLHPTRLEFNLSAMKATTPKERKPEATLKFKSDFECGNLEKADMVNEHEYDLYIRTDLTVPNPKNRVWFYFSITGMRAGQKVILNIVNFSKKKSLYRLGATPVVRSRTHPDWKRLPSQNVFYYRAPRLARKYVLSMVFEFDSADDEYYFAYSFPYTYTQLQNYLDLICQQDLSFFSRELLGYSVEKRRIDLVTITSLNEFDSKKKRYVCITARVHPGESPSSWVCQGLIDFLISSDPRAITLRQNLVFKIVPMLNPDGVWLGNYRGNTLGFDLNRHWLNPSPEQQPEIYVTKREIMRLVAKENVSLEFFIDVHAHSTLMDAFTYGNVHESSERFQKEKEFPMLLDQNISDFSFKNTSFKERQQDESEKKQGTGRRTLGDFLGAQCRCYTLEASFFMHREDRDKNVPYTISKYRVLGKNVVLTFLDFWELD